MKRIAVWIVVALALGCGLDASAASPEGDLYQLGIAFNQEGMRGSWGLVGKEGDWKGVRAGAILQDRLYTAETDGTLRVTRLDNGQRTKIGKPDFGGTTFMFAGEDCLWTIETNGNLFRVDPADGGWKRVGANGGWKAVRAGAVLKDNLYTVETDGALVATDLSSGKRRRLGKAEFGDTVALLAARQSLWTVEADGDQYRVDPNDASRKRLGADMGRKGPLAAAAVNGQLYRIMKNGTLHETRLPEGNRNQLGKPDFANTAFMFGGNHQIYTIEADGSLYAVYVRPPEDIDGWDCFPREFEKVFQEQAKGFYRNSQTRQILGRRATHAGIMEGLGWLRTSATKKDMVVMYFTCHGGTDPTEGWSVGTADNKLLRAQEIKAELAKIPCHALVFIETCGSGGFAAPHKNDPPVPPNVTVLCACSGKQSASNELDIAALEALWGRADFSRDGVVELDEMLRYVEARYKELYPATRKANQDAVRPVLVRAKNVPGSLPLTRVSPQLGAVAHDGEIYSALVTPKQGDKYHVHVLGYNNQPGSFYVTSAATRDALCLPNDGPPLEVRQNGSWYPARLLGRAGNQFRVHYLGYNEEEVVSRDRMRYVFVGEPDGDKGGKK